MKDIAVGTVTGTGSAINVSLGWIPDYVKVYNENDAGSLWPTIEWWRGMSDGHALKGLKVIDSGSSGNASQAKITSGGISQYSGDTTHAPGFTIGTDTDINANGEAVFYIAVRSRTD